MMKPMEFLLCVAAIGCVSSASALDNSIIGYVKTVAGDAQLVADGVAVKAQAGTPVRLDNVLKTGKPGSMGVTFKDNTRMSIGPDTELVVDEYLYAPGKGDVKLNTRLNKGSLDYVSGLIAKFKPEAVMLRTPTGNIGVRGTHLAIKLEDQ